MKDIKMLGLFDKDYDPVFLKEDGSYSIGVDVIAELAKPHQENYDVRFFHVTDTRGEDELEEFMSLCRDTHRAQDFKELFNKFYRMAV